MGAFMLCRFIKITFMVTPNHLLVISHCIESKNLNKQPFVVTSDVLFSSFSMLVK